jgi:mannosyltransferase
LIRTLSPSARERLRLSVILFGIVLVALALRVYRLADESPWWDEVASLRHLGAPTVTDFLRLEHSSDPFMPPVYFVLEYYWAHFVGPSVLSLRLLSVILGLLGVLMMFVVTRRLYGAAAGLVAALCMALSMTHIYYSQEIRVYPLMVLLTLVSVYALLRGEESRQVRWWAAHFTVNALLAFTHIVTVLLFIAEGCFLAYRRRSLRVVAAWTLPHAAIAALLLAWLIGVGAMGGQKAVSWIVAPGLRDIVMVLLVFAGGRPSNENPASHLPTGVTLDWALGAILSLVIVWFAAKVLALRGKTLREPLGDRTSLCLLLLWLLLPPSFLIIVSYAWKPCFVYRYVLYSSLPLYILVGGAFSVMRRRWTAGLLGCVLLILSAYQLSALSIGPFRPDWRSLSRYLEARADESAVILAYQEINQIALQYNSVLPETRIQCVPVWSAACDPILRAHAEGHDAWLIVWLWSSPANIEDCFTSNTLMNTKVDFEGWPRLRLYHVPAPAAQEQG